MPSFLAMGRDEEILTEKLKILGLWETTNLLLYVAVYLSIVAMILPISTRQGVFLIKCCKLVALAHVAAYSYHLIIFKLGEVD